MNTLSSTSNLQKQLVSSKSFTTLFNRHFAKQNAISSQDSDRWKQLEKIGQEKGIRKWEIKLVNHSQENIKHADVNAFKDNDKRSFTNREFNTHSAEVYKYKSNPWFDYEHDEINSLNNQKLLDKVSKLEHRISVLEYKREYELKQASIREQEIRHECESILKAKETELLNSRNQINHLLRIIEQMATVKMKETSTLESKGSSTERKSSDDNRIIIQERLEITDEGDNSIYPSDSHRK